MYPRYLLLVKPLDDEICAYTPEPDKGCCERRYEECRKQNDQGDADAYNGEDNGAENGKNERGDKGEDEDGDGEDQEEPNRQGGEGDLGEDEGLSKGRLARKVLVVNGRGWWGGAVDRLTASIGFSVANFESLADS